MEKKNKQVRLLVIIMKIGEQWRRAKEAGDTRKQSKLEEQYRAIMRRFYTRAPAPHGRQSLCVDGVEFRVGDKVRLPAIPDDGVPEQEAEILEIDDSYELAIFCVVPRDRMEDDHDGLLETSFFGVTKL